MKREVRDKWVEALQSGKFSQGKEQLITFEDGEDRHCCLAVLGIVCEYPINPNGFAFEGDQLDSSSKKEFYKPLQNHLTYKQLVSLYKVNDDTIDLDKRDYSNVIPAILELEVED